MNAQKELILAAANVYYDWNNYYEETIILKLKDDEVEEIGNIDELDLIDPKTAERILETLGKTAANKYNTYEFTKKEAKTNVSLSVNS